MPKNVELSSGSRTLREFLNRQLINVRPIIVNADIHRKCGSSALSLQTAIFLTINFTIGIGILNFPKVFADSGNLTGALILSGILSVFIIGSIVILSYCVDICGADNYEDVVRFFCGPLYSDICAGTIVLYIFGGCMSAFVIIGDQSDRLLASLYGSNFCQFWYLNRQFVVPLVAVTLILPLCFAKHIEFLKYPSLGGVLVSVYLVFLIIRQYYQSTAKFSLKSSNWTRATIVIPIVCYGFQVTTRLICNILISTGFQRMFGLRKRLSHLK
ncbi:putative sodium-coupled neutral amino acid transporter 7 isoform X2 [Tetranychus urticae]|uniref:putative sodium-coupled neutral amino acid transporter 7 isoform X2 n=1 Tax=Tetranychus urticae TaxID=32264 RepID=UPI00077BC977|nr:putative sodium-coupled neutral amino acid transporter 7 isoform X2 [Tetranychus urticae]